MHFLIRTIINFNNASVFNQFKIQLYVLSTQYKHRIYSSNSISILEELETKLKF